MTNPPAIVGTIEPATPALPHIRAGVPSRPNSATPPASRSKILRDTLLGLALAGMAIGTVGYVGMLFQRTGERFAAERAVETQAAYLDFVDALEESGLLLESSVASDGSKSIAVAPKFFSQRRTAQLHQLERIWRYGRSSDDERSLVVYMIRDKRRHLIGEYLPTTGLVESEP